MKQARLGSITSCLCSILIERFVEMKSFRILRQRYQVEPPRHLNLVPLTPATARQGVPHFLHSIFSCIRLRIQIVHQLARYDRALNAR
jgi:hypothetical protein